MVMARPNRPSRAELSRRARAIKLVLSDCDGVLTDTGVYYGESGEALKRFSIRDGMGVERLRKAGIESAIITGESSPSVLRRAEKLQLHVFLGVKDKLAHLGRVMSDAEVEKSEIAYIGDDYNDLPLLAAIAETGLTGAPSDAMPKVKAAVHRRCRAPGGLGAFRDFAEWILRLRESQIETAAVGQKST
jgi:3-deoxy-D-manno-octulosonate 8-phosphate phosphatase (KDO 8-P phosphatase)